jgi:hypothetical protein
VVGLDENMGKKEDIVNEVQVKNKRLEHAAVEKSSCSQPPTRIDINVPA